MDESLCGAISKNREMRVKSFGLCSFNENIFRLQEEMMNRPSVNKTIFLAMFFFILSVACYIRYPGIDFQLPDFAYPDETAIIHSALTVLATKNFNLSLGFSQWGLVYAPFYTYLMVPLGFLFYLCSGVLGLGFSESAYNLPLWVFYYIGRFFSFLLGIAGIAMLVKLCNDHFNKRVAVVAAIFLAGNPTHVSFSVYAKPDALMCLLLLVVLYLALKIPESRKIRDYVLVGFLSGLAIATKLNALSIIVPVIGAHLLGSYDKRAGLQSNLANIFLNKKVYVCFGFIFIGFFVGNPYSLLDYPEFIRQVKTNFLTNGLLASGAYESTGSILGDIFSLEVSKTTMLIYSGLFKMLGDGYIIFLSLGGLLYAIVRHRKGDIILLSFALTTIFLCIPSLRTASEHHIFPASLVLIVFSAVFLVEIFERLKSCSKFMKNRQVMFGSKVTLDLFLIMAILFFIKIPFYVSKSFINSLTGRSAGIEEASVREWILRSIPVGANIAYSHGYGPFLSKKLYELDEKHPNERLSFFKEKYDFLIINEYRRRCNDYPLLFESLKNVKPVKTFPKTSIFNYGLEIYPMNSLKKEIFEFQLNRFRLKKGDYAGIRAHFKGEAGKGYALLTHVYDEYALSGYEDYIKQRILIDSQVVWENDIGDETGSGWKKSEHKFIADADGTKITIEVRAASQKITPGWADPSLTRIKVGIFDDKGKECLTKWDFIADNGKIIKFKNFYTETLNIDQERKTVFNIPSFELDAGRYWAFKSSMYEKGDKNALDLTGNWLAIGARTRNGLVEINRSSRFVSGGGKSLHLVCIGEGEQYAVRTVAGQVIPKDVKEGLRDFSIDFYIPKEEVASENYHVQLRVLAESIGGQFLKEKVYSLYDSRNSTRGYELDRWNTFKRNIKRDFNHLFMKWDYVDFMTFTIELENNDMKPAAVYIDNIQTDVI